mgnify:CR=1 FL=1
MLFCLRFLKEHTTERLDFQMTTQTATRSKTYDMVYIAVFAVLIAICSWISIPTTVPFTLQTFAVFLAEPVSDFSSVVVASVLFLLNINKILSGADRK